MIIRGRLLTDPSASPEPGWVRVEGGRIAEVRYGDVPADDRAGCSGGNDRIICPAFTDAHLHLPQIESIGCDGMPLLKWLDEIIFPAEGWWGRGAAMSMAQTAVRRMAAEGTVGFAAYLTSHGEINRQVLGFLEKRSRMRFAAGRVAMDRKSTDELTAEDRERTSLQPIPSPVLPVDEGGQGRWLESANPRFAISCTEELMAEIGWYAKEHPETVLQTHLSESGDELKYVKELFPDDPHYTAIYDRLGLLTPKMLLAHAIHLSSEELTLIAERGSAVIHCPCANTFLQAGMFNWDAVREHGVRMGLGTDVAAGPDIAMPRVARAMIEVAKCRKMASGSGGAPSVRIPTPAEVWEIITKTNAELVGWDDCGVLEPGEWADLLVLRVPETWLDKHIVGRLIYNWTSSLIETRIFAGEIVDPGTI